jgi:hypothetical protein
MKKVLIMILFLASCGLVPDGEQYHSDESVRSNDNSTAATSYTTDRILATFRK